MDFKKLSEKEIKEFYKQKENSIKNYLIKFNDQPIGLVSSLKNSIRETEIGFSATGRFLFNGLDQSSWIYKIEILSSQHLPIQIFIQDKNNFTIAQLENCWLKNSLFTMSGENYFIYDNAQIEFENFLKVI